jgi:hypothetical protein
VGHWRFDEGNGTSVMDETGSGNDGTMSGGITWLKSGFPGAMFTNPGALRFDGVDGIIDLASFKNLPALDAKKSLSVWINFAAYPATGSRPVIGFGDSKTGGARLKLGLKGNQIAVWKGDASVVVGAAAAVGAWHHVVYTFDGTTNHMFVDGADKGNSTTSSDSAAMTQAHIGSFGTEHFAGDVDDLRVYNRALSAAEVMALHGGGE